MSNGKDAPGAVKKKRFPATLESAYAVPTRAPKPWDAIERKTTPPYTAQVSSAPRRPVVSTATTNKASVPVVSKVASTGGMAAARQRMVQRLQQLGIQHQDVLGAMGAVPRELFIDSALTNQAYEDTSLPIGLGQTISKPSVVARMIELLLPEDGHKLGRVLDIGTGCGYQAAVLSHVVTEVYSIERLRGLHEKARVNLRPLRLRNVHLIYADGMLGFPSGAPYDAIISAAGANNVPRAWLEQLALGGCLIAPVELNSGVQSLVKVVRTEQGWQQYELEAVQFVPLRSGVL